MDDDFGVVKEEIVEEDCPLPCFNGRVVSWLVSAGSSRWQTFHLCPKGPVYGWTEHAMCVTLGTRIIFGKSQNCNSQTAALCSVMQIQAHSAVSLMRSPLSLLVRISRSDFL